jgi:multidrug resistance efflux pump
MEIIKDLDLLIKDGEKIAKFAKIFTRLPEIMTVINSSETYLAELTAKVNGAKSQLDSVNQQIEAGKAALESANAEANRAKELAASAGTMAAVELKTARDNAQDELEKTLKANKEATDKAVKGANEKLKQINASIEVAEAILADKLKKHDMRLGELADEEKVARERLETVKAALAALKAQL